MLDIPVAKRRPTTLDDAEVGRIVRAFASRIALLRADWHTGIGPRDVLPLIESEARTFGSSLALTAHGNALCRVLLPAETLHMGEPGAALGLWVAGQVVGLLVAIEDGETEDDVRQKLADLLEDVTARLVGAKY